MDGGWGRSKAATENNYGYQCGYQKSVLLYYEYMVLIYMIFLKVTGGETGIRTLDTLLTYTPLAGERFRPLSHLSELTRFWASYAALPCRNGCVKNSYNGALGGSRTPDLLVRSQMLYPAELPAHAGAII